MKKAPAGGTAGAQMRESGEGLESPASDGR